MPLVRIDLRRGKSATYKKAISDGVYQALREIFTVPENDRFMVVTDRDTEDFLYEPNYLGIDHSADFVMLQITVSNTRTVEQKQALYARIVEFPGYESFAQAFAGTMPRLLCAMRTCAEELRELDRRLLATDERAGRRGVHPGRRSR